jgi:hypothetical protein
MMPPMQSPALAGHLRGKELFALKRSCAERRVPRRCERVSGGPMRQDGLGATESATCDDAPRPKLPLCPRSTSLPPACMDAGDDAAVIAVGGSIIYPPAE